MNTVIIWAVFILESFSVDFVKAKECVTPYQENATCLPIKDCHVVTSALYTLTPQAIQFYKDSQCGCDQGMLCCGTSNDQFYPELINCTRVAQSSKIELSWISDSSVCGLHSTTDKIIGGELVKEEEFPWLALLEYNNKYTNENAGIHCAGSIITNKFVLTAAHCILDVEFEIIKVWLGVSNITSEETCYNGNIRCMKSVKKVNVARTIPHEWYDRIYKSNDIGLLELEAAIEFSNYIRPICLISSRSISPRIGTFLTVAGWGTTENGRTSEVKLKVKLPLRDNQVCQDYLNRSNRNITLKQLCVGGEIGKDSCEGDSGGPIMYDFVGTIGEGQWIQLGIVSYGLGCGIQGKPAVYTKVSSYNRWIIFKIADKNSHLDKGDQCRMPDGTMGTCAQLSKCPETLKITLNKSEYYNYSKKLGDQCLTPLNGEIVVCCKNPGPISSPNFNTTSVLPDKTTCGIVKEESEIKGNEAHLPWIAGIEVSTGQFHRNQIRCLGTVITSRYVLTIVDCVFGRENDKLEPTNVWLGCWNSSRCNRVQKIGIQKIIPYPVFASPAFNQYTLLLLEKNIQFGDYIRPICLSSPNLPRLELGAGVTSVWLRNNSSRTEPITSSDVVLKEEFPFRHCHGDNLPQCIAEESMLKTNPLIPYRPISIIRRYKDTASGRIQWYLVAVDNLEHKYWYTQYDGILFIPNIINSLDWILTIISENN